MAIDAWWPLSRTKADDLPHANEAKTGSLTKNSAGTLYFSKRCSVSFMRFSFLWIAGSVNKIGVS